MKHFVLIAASDAATRIHLADGVSHGGYQVETAHDGVECVRKLRFFRPEVLILDLELLWGGYDGVLAFLREEYVGHDVPTVILVGRMPEHRVAAMVSPPVVRYVRKPITCGGLIATIQQCRGAIAV